MTLSELAAKLGAAPQGDPSYPIRGVRDIERLAPDAELEDGFVYFIESKAVLKRHVKAGPKGAILTTKELAPSFKTALAIEGDARLTFIKLLSLYDPLPRHPAGVSPAAHVDASAKVASSAAVLPGAVVMAGAVIGERCVVYPNAVIETRAVVGEDTVIRSNVVVGHDCVIGKRCLIHAGTVIGADGFGFYDGKTGRHKVPHIGNVVIADDVELGASCTVDRAAIASTTIGQFTKLDDQVHVGHNCTLGKHIYIAGNSALGGSVVMGDGAMISGMVVVKDHLTLAPGSVILGGSGLAQDTEPKQAYFGLPARPAREMHKINAAAAELPALLKRVRELEAKLGVAPSGA